MSIKPSKKKLNGILPIRKLSKSSKDQRKAKRTCQLHAILFAIIIILLIALFLVGLMHFDEGKLFSNHVSLNIINNNRRHSDFQNQEKEKRNEMENPITKSHPCDGFITPPPPPLDKKRTGPRPCVVCYMAPEEAEKIMPSSPTVSSVLKNLTYAYTKKPGIVKKVEGGEGSLFGGYHSLSQRDLYFDIVPSMVIPCGFFQGKKPGRNTGFDIDFFDLLEMEECRKTVVISAIFDNFDVMQQPKHISELSKKEVCFYMFVDEKTIPYITIDKERKAGLWRIVVVRNLPYDDPRRSGKIPKLLGHRLFPNAKYSIWIDGKLQLIQDPYQILERYLWRKNASFAISNHYKRFDVFEEAEANKAAGKYENVSIDRQIEFYKKEGLTHYSSAKLPIVSDVPEGSVIIREHSPITNLLTCAWFNEVDRFTSRDQISYSTARDKIVAKDKSFNINMFKDCERRNFVIQSYHKDLLEQTNSSASRSPSLRVVKKISTNATKNARIIIASKMNTRDMNPKKSVLKAPPRIRVSNKKSMKDKKSISGDNNN